MDKDIKDLSKKPESIFDLGTDKGLKEAIESGIRVFTRWMKELESIPTSGKVKCGHCNKFNIIAICADAIAKIVGLVSKAVDGMYRLMEFAQGKADSRPDITGGNFANLSELTDERFKAVVGIIEDNQREKEEDEGKESPETFH